MATSDLLDAVQERGDLDSPEEARRASEAVLSTLGERVSGGEAGELADELPGEVAGAVESDDPAAPFGVEEFFARVADREGVEEATARAYSRAVLDALSDTTARAELEDAREQLPDEFDVAFERGQSLSADEVIDAVAGESPLSERSRVEAALVATLETLGERISRGQADDVATYLPAEFRDHLVENAAEEPPEFGPGEFVSRVAGQAGLDETAGDNDDEATESVRAVFAALSRVVADRQLREVRAQLPDEYDTLFEVPETGE